MGLPLGQFISRIMSEASTCGVREAAAQHYGFVPLCERLPSKRSGATCPDASRGGFVSDALGGLPSIRTVVFFRRSRQRVAEQKSNVVFVRSPGGSVSNPVQ